MTGISKLFLDTSPLVYYLDDDERYADRVEDFLYVALKAGVEILTSVITATEDLTYPYKTGNMEKVVAFFDFVTYTGIPLVPIDATIAQKAAQIRAEYRHSKTMDALQLASACVYGCDVFLTNDKQLCQFAELRCVTLD